MPANPDMKSMKPSGNTIGRIVLERRLAGSRLINRTRASALVQGDDHAMPACHDHLRCGQMARTPAGVAGGRLARCHRASSLLWQLGINGGERIVKDRRRPGRVNLCGF
jgi:hypothetical protein